VGFDNCHRLVDAFVFVYFFFGIDFFLGEYPVFYSVGDVVSVFVCLLCFHDADFADSAEGVFCFGFVDDSEE